MYFWLAGHAIIDKVFSNYHDEVKEKLTAFSYPYYFMQDFRNLKVWQKGHELALLIYRTTTPK